LPEHRLHLKASYPTTVTAVDFALCTDVAPRFC
jgi:hypothetical protein